MRSEGPKIERGKGAATPVPPVSTSGERCKFSQRGPERSPGRKRILVVQELRKRLKCEGQKYIFYWGRRSPRGIDAINYKCSLSGVASCVLQVIMHLYFGRKKMMMMMMIVNEFA